MLPALLQSSAQNSKEGKMNTYDVNTIFLPDDYEGKVVVGAEFAKELRLVQFVDGKSTTATIARINEGAVC